MDILSGNPVVMHLTLMYFLRHAPDPDQYTGKGKGIANDRVVHRYTGPGRKMYCSWWIPLKYFHRALDWIVGHHKALMKELGDTKVACFTLTPEDKEQYDELVKCGFTSTFEHLQPRLAYFPVKVEEYDVYDTTTKEFTQLAVPLEMAPM